MFKAKKSIFNRSELIGLAAVPALIYALIPGTNLYQRELSQGIKITSPACLFDKSIALEKACLSDKDIILRFTAEKPLLLFQTVEARLINAKGETIYFLQTALTTRPQFAAKDSRFDFRMPNCSNAYKEAKYLSIKVMNRDGGALKPSIEPHRTNLLINL